MTLSRTDRSRLAEWTFTVDRGLLTAFLLLIAIGVVLSFAASPEVAIKKGLPTYYFVERHIIFAFLSAVVLFAVSLLSPRAVRRFALVLLAVAFAAMVAVLLFGAELNGAQRWLSFFGHTVQPSEFAKPAFVVTIAWMFAEAGRRDLFAAVIAFLLWGVFAVLLVAQPDVGQTVLISVTAGILYVLAGLSIRGAAVMALAGSAGLWLAYENFDHVRLRFDRFFSPLPNESFQTDRAIESFTQGGLLGRGPGEGTIKSVLPDAHTDFIFAVVAEEYGVLVCIGLLALFAYIVLRSLMRAYREPDATNRLAIQGLAIVFGLQAAINMGVNVGLIPPKGMTLPFISAGGSSMLALAITGGMLLALTRRRADPLRLKKPRMVPTIDAGDLSGRQPIR